MWLPYLAPYHFPKWVAVSKGHHASAPVMYYIENPNHSGIHHLFEPILLLRVITLDVPFTVFFQTPVLPDACSPHSPIQGHQLQLTIGFTLSSSIHISILHQDAADAIVTSHKIPKISSSVYFSTVALIHSVPVVTSLPPTPPTTLRKHSLSC